MRRSSRSRDAADVSKPPRAVRLPRPLPVGHERRALLLGGNGKLAIVLSLVVLLEPGVRRRDRRDARQTQLLRQSVLQRAEQPL
jgi:hypothetical protein